MTPVLQNRWNPIWQNIGLLHFQISILHQGKLTSYSADLYTWKICSKAILNDNINYNIYKTSFHKALK